MEIRLRTLTPLWTGGAGRNSDRLRETGLLGSLRWWYEGIVRGMGGRVCDATADDASKRCIFEQKKGETFEDAYAHLCLACRLFGCTGWRRRFRLEVDGLEAQALFFVASSDVHQAAGNWLWRMFGGEELGGDRKGRGAAVTFALGVEALWGQQATLRVVPLGSDAEGTLARVAFLLETIARWGALGAKPQHGFGQIEVTDGLEPSLVEEGRRLVVADVRDESGTSQPDFFNLNHFFSRTFRLAQPEPYQGTGREIGTPPRGFDYRQHFIPCAFDIRYKSRGKDFRTGKGKDFGMRPWFRERWGTGVAHRLFGRSDARRDEDRSAGRIHVSHLYRPEPGGPWHLKVWGHVPSNLKDDRGNPISVEDVAGQVTAFVQTMFSDSRLVDEFNQKEVLGR
ncbi:MAG: type III-B CRISPR module RAMP protein Cmr1 [Anaerolineae bacterium]|nr:type III-B CRISPR module RAMP protein Cmr1 [Anaerolineae bacterium]